MGKNISYSIIVLFYLLTNFSAKAQSIDIGQIGKGKPFKINGGFSTNSVYYISSDNTASYRDPFTYYLNANLVFSLYSYSMPVSFSYSNQEFDYQHAFKFNRLSLHPTYKWITAHIGDAAMSFSPYTLNGHQFTGFGVDLKPQGSVQVSAMCGRLLKAVEPIPEEEQEGRFRRMGYGVKTVWQREQSRIGAIVFYARDDEKSLSSIPEEGGVTPQENLVISLDGSVDLLNLFQLSAEYAVSGLTRDVRSVSVGDGEGYVGWFLNNRATTSYFSAFKTSLQGSSGSTAFGVGYERIDPGYQTLGAYYFTNDLENITVNLAQAMFQNRLSVSVNAGLQRDDLDARKSSQMTRMVGAANINFRPGESLNFNLSYSNFQTYTNIKTYYQKLTELSKFDNLDTLNFTQISQNANLNVNWVIKNTKSVSQNLNVNLTFQDAADEQGGIVRKGNSSQFYNANTVYTIAFPTNHLSLSGAFNCSYNTIGVDNSITWGPSLSVRKKFLENKLNSGLSCTYNRSDAGDGQSINHIGSIRANAGYTLLKKHNFTLSCVTLYRKRQKSTTDFTATFAYSYSF